MSSSPSNVAPGSGNTPSDLTPALVVNADSASDSTPSLAVAMEATEGEHKMTLKQAYRIYLPGIRWSLFLSSTVAMAGYDMSLMSAFYALSQFNGKYGSSFTKKIDGREENVWEVPAEWKVVLNVAALGGEIGGLWISGVVSQRYGYRKTMIGALLFMVGAIFVPFFAQSLWMLLVGQILCGLPWGVFQTLPAAYASEVVPEVLRPYLCSYINLCWIMGQMMAAGVVRGMLNVQSEWAYRIPFAIQWLWPIPIIGGIIFAPESPWWLVRQGRLGDARASVLRLTTRKDASFDAHASVSLIHNTNEQEKRVSAGTSFMDCVRGGDRRRTEICCAVWAIQALCGSVYLGYAPVFFEKAGLPKEWAFNLTLIQYSLGVIGTGISWVLVPRCGRRSMYLWGLFMLMILLSIIGSTGLAPEHNKAAQWAGSGVLILFTFVYGTTVGPTCFALIAEISSTRLKAKTIVLARLSYNIGSIVAHVFAGYQLTGDGADVYVGKSNDSGWGWGPKSAFFWAAMCSLCVVYVFFRVPEPQGRDYDDMNTLFENDVSARDFSKMDVDSVGRTVVKRVKQAERRRGRRVGGGTSSSAVKHDESK